MSAHYPAYKRLLHTVNALVLPYTASPRTRQNTVLADSAMLLKNRLPAYQCLLRIERGAACTVLRRAVLEQILPYSCQKAKAASQQ